MNKYLLGFAAVATAATFAACCTRSSCEPKCVPSVAYVCPNAEQQVILDSMKLVNDWMLDNLNKVGSRHLAPTDWTRGAWFAGIWAFYDISKEKRAYDALMNLENTTKWKIGKKRYFGDDQAIGQTYLDIYRFLNRNPIYIKDVKAVVDDMIANKPVDNTDMTQHMKVHTLGEWSWCDGLFMAPPIWVKLARITGEKEKYLTYMDAKWKKTYDFLFDKEENLYYRDASYFPEKRMEKNGKKIFWGRGNGWVIGGLCLMLRDLPKDWKTTPEYVDLFQRMMKKIVECQQPDGFWRASMLDPANYPSKETSGTAFFCYGLAFGINNGYLDRDEYMPALEKAWAALNSVVDADGKLCYAQPIGQDPRHVKREHSEVYAVGAYLLAGVEIYKMKACCPKNK